MSAYVDILNSWIDQDSPVTQELLDALRGNPSAIAEGVTGAPRIAGLAVARAGDGLVVLNVAASDARQVTFGLLSVVGTLETGSATDVVAHTYTMQAYSGVVRCKASHYCGSGFTHVLSLYKNGVLVTAFSSTANQVVEARVVDVSISAGDVLEWRHRTAGNTSTVSAVSMTASDAYVQIIPLIPASAV